MTVSVFQVTVSQKDSCSIELTCHFALRSTANECLVYWRTRQNSQTIGNLTLTRETSPDNNIAVGVTANTFHKGTLLEVVAVGVRNGEFTDTLPAITHFGVVEEARMECQQNRRMLCML